jgi:hypothetical protein
MWRAFFLAVGIFICVVGLECLVIEKALFANFSQAPPPDPFSFSEPVKRVSEISPPEWAPWGFMAAGVVVILYSFTVPRRLHG